MAPGRIAIIPATIAVVAVGYAAVAIATFPRWTVDDAFIVLRYAENLARHGALTWNVGDDPVEGYTGVLLPLAVAGAFRLGIAPETAAHALDIAGFFATLAALAALLRRMAVAPVARASAIALVATAPILFTHATSGLETTIFSALAVSSLLAFDRAVEIARPRDDLLLFALLLALALARPEGVAVAAVALPLLLGARGRTAAWPTLARAAAVAVPGALYFAWRVAYYGQLMPNTFYAKRLRHVSFESAENLALFLALYLFLPAAAVAALVAVAPRRSLEIFRRQRPGARLGVALALLAVASVAVQYLRAALIMNYAFRFWAPFYPLLVAALAVVASAALEALREREGRPRRGAVAAAAALLVAQLCGHALFLPREREFAWQTARLIEDEHAPIARFLADRVPPGETIVVVVDAGAIPYFSKLRTIDFGGLNDEFLSRRFVDRIPEARVVDYFYAHDAAALVFTSNAWDHIAGPEPAPITSDPRFERYVLAGKYRSDEHPNYFEFVYLRRDLVDGARAMARS
jgi:hypothetical protein